MKRIFVALDASDRAALVLAAAAGLAELKRAVKAGIEARDLR
jgi:hypothetical protein